MGCSSGCLHFPEHLARFPLSVSFVDKLWVIFLRWYSHRITSCCSTYKKKGKIGRWKSIIVNRFVLFEKDKEEQGGVSSFSLFWTFFLGSRKISTVEIIIILHIDTHERQKIIGIWVLLTHLRSRFSLKCGSVMATSWPGQNVQRGEHMEEEATWSYLLVLALFPRGVIPSIFLALLVDFHFKIR